MLFTNSVKALTDEGQHVAWCMGEVIQYCLCHRSNLQTLLEQMDIGIEQMDTKIGVIVVSPTTWEAHHSPRAKPKGCGELPRSLVTP